MTKKFIPAAKYHLLTPLFDLGCALFGLGKRYRNFILRNIDVPTQKLRILDAGCGSGALAIDLIQKYPNAVMYGVDADTRILTIAKEKAEKKKVLLHTRHAFLQKLPFSDESLDIIYSSLVFHHLASKDKIKAMKEINRVLKKNGIFYLIDFGKPKNMLLAPFSWLTTIFEEGKDNYRGLIPVMLKQAGFTKIIAKDGYWFSIVCWKCER